MLGQIRAGLALVALALAACGTGGESSDRAAVPLEAGGQRLTVPVISFKTLRERNLVRQGWDISCGAAALSTILTHQYGSAYSEATIAVSILQNTDPRLVRARGGFSLLDIKRFAEAVGYKAEGYGELTIDDLVGFGVPAILPVRIRDYDHFVVFRGRAGNRVLIGDPAFGNMTIPLYEFRNMWPSRIGMIIVPADTEIPVRNRLAPDATNMMVPNLNQLYRTLRGGGPVPAVRRPRIGTP